MNKLSSNQVSVNLDVIYLEALATFNSSLPEERRFEFDAITSLDISKIGGNRYDCRANDLKKITEIANRILQSEGEEWGTIKSSDIQASFRNLLSSHILVMGPGMSKREIQKIKTLYKRCMSRGESRENASIKTASFFAQKRALDFLARGEKPDLRFYSPKDIEKLRFELEKNPQRRIRIKELEDMASHSEEGHIKKVSESHLKQPFSFDVDSSDEDWLDVMNFLKEDSFLQDASLPRTLSFQGESSSSVSMEEQVRLEADGQGDFEWDLFGGRL